MSELARRRAHEPWELQPGDLPPAWVVAREPRLAGLEDSAAFRWIAQRYRRLRRWCMAQAATAMIAGYSMLFVVNYFYGQDRQTRAIDFVNELFPMVLAMLCLGFNSSGYRSSMVAVLVSMRVRSSETDAFLIDLAFAGLPAEEIALAVWGFASCDRILRFKRYATIVAFALPALMMALPIHGLITNDLQWYMDIPLFAAGISLGLARSGERRALSLVKLVLFPLRARRIVRILSLGGLIRLWLGMLAVLLWVEALVAFSGLAGLQFRYISWGFYRLVCDRLGLPSEAVKPLAALLAVGAGVALGMARAAGCRRSVDRNLAKLTGYIQDLIDAVHKERHGERPGDWAR